MKTLIILFAAIVFAATSFAQNRILVLPTKDSVLFHIDRGWLVSTMTQPITLQNGTTISPSGLMQTKDGKTTPLKNGDYVDSIGNIASLDINEAPNKGLVMNNGKMMQILKAQKESPMMNEHYIKSDGKIWIVEFMSSPFTTTTGITVFTDGTAKTKDGKTFTLQNNDCIDENGNTTKVDRYPKIMHCVYMHYGKMISISELKTSAVFKNDLTLMPDGTVKKTDGTTYTMSEGGQMSLDGTALLDRSDGKGNVH